MTIEINGMAHVILTVSRFEIAREFYRKLLPEFGMKVVHDEQDAGFSIALALEPQLALNPALRRWPANASSNSVSACTTSVFAPVRARTWIGVLLCSRE